MPGGKTRNQTEQPPHPPASLTEGSAHDSNYPCAFWRVLPVRYALCHRGIIYDGDVQELARKRSILGEEYLPDLALFNYTLRELRKGWVHVHYSGNSGVEKHSFKYDGKTFTKIVTDAEGNEAVAQAGEKWIEIPREITSAYFAFSPCNWDTAAWDAYTYSARFQEIPLNPKKWTEKTKYCALISRLADLVEEYKESPGQLHYLANWRKSVFDPSEEKEYSFSDNKPEIVQKRWNESKIPIQWKWKEGKSDLQKEIEAKCASDDDAYLVALWDPIGCTQDLASINVYNMQALTLLNGWYGYPQLLAEMTECYVKANGGTDKKKVLGVNGEREETYHRFLEKRRSELTDIHNILQWFFKDWAKFFDTTQIFHYPTTLGILIWDYSLGKMKKTDAAANENDDDATAAKLEDRAKEEILKEREKEFAACISSIAAHQLGKQLVKDYFLRKPVHTEQYELLKEILHGGVVIPDNRPFGVHSHIFPKREEYSAACIPPTPELGDILRSLELALAELAQGNIMEDYKDLMGITAARLNNALGGTLVFNPQNRTGANDVPENVPLGEYLVLLERCLAHIQEPDNPDANAPKGAGNVTPKDFTKEYPHPFPNKQNTIEQLASYTNIGNALADGSIAAMDIHYYTTMRAFARRGSSLSIALKAFKRIALPACLAANAGVFAKNPSWKSGAGVVMVLLGMGPSINAASRGLLFLRPGLVSGIGNLSEKALVESVIKTNMGRAIGGLGVLVTGGIELYSLFENEEVIEAKLGFSYACIGQALLFSCNPYGIAVGFILAIGGTIYYYEFKRDFESDWFRTAYWGKKYGLTSKKQYEPKYPPFSLAQNRIAQSDEDKRHFVASLTSHIYHGSPPFMNVVTDDSLAYVNIVAPNFQIGKSWLAIYLGRVDDDWKNHQRQVLADLENERQNEIKMAAIRAERYADEKSLPSTIRNEGWAQLYNVQKSKLLTEINEKYNELKITSPKLRIDWENPDLYHTPMRTRIVNGAACCEMIIDLKAVAAIHNMKVDPSRIILEAWGGFQYDKDSPVLRVPLQDVDTSNFKATDPIDVDKHKTTRLLIQDDHISYGEHDIPDYTNPWGYSRYATVRHYKEG